MKPLCWDIAHLDLLQNMRSLLQTPKLILKKISFFSTKYKNEWKKCKFWRQKNQNKYFYKNKKVEIDVGKILFPKKEPYGANKSNKYFIGYNVNDVVRPLFMKIPQMVGHDRCFDSNNTMSFKVTDKNC